MSSKKDGEKILVDLKHSVLSKTNQGFDKICTAGYFNQNNPKNMETNKSQGRVWNKTCLSYMRQAFRNE